MNIDKFIERARVIHGDLYDYSQAEYIDYRTPLGIICPFHGLFYQSPNKHLSKKRGCTKCAVEKRAKTQILNKSLKFKDKANIVHHWKYDYKKSEYKGVKIPLIITCPIHGDFYQTPNDHLQGHGCPKCNQSKLELEIENMLKLNNIQYLQQEKVPNDEKLKFDFYLPNHNIAIECQGEQHFEELEYFGGYDGLLQTIQRDERKFLACARARIDIIYYINNINIYNNILNNIYLNNKIYNSNNIFNSIKDILDYINNK